MDKACAPAEVRQFLTLLVSVTIVKSKKSMLYIHEASPSDVVPDSEEQWPEIRNRDSKNFEQLRVGKNSDGWMRDLTQ